MSDDIELGPIEPLLRVEPMLDHRAGDAPGQEQDGTVGADVRRDRQDDEERGPPTTHPYEVLPLDVAPQGQICDDQD